jgi:hypothetical protein
MTAAQAENPVTEGIRSLEVRWIFPGQANTAVARVVRAVPGPGGITRGRLPSQSQVAWAFGKDPRAWRPWHVIPADHKWFSHISTIAILLETMTRLLLFPHAGRFTGSTHLAH